MANKDFDGWWHGPDRAPDRKREPLLQDEDFFDDDDDDDDDDEYEDEDEDDDADDPDGDDDEPLQQRIERWRTAS